MSLRLCDAVLGYSRCLWHAPATSRALRAGPTHSRRFPSTGPIALPFKGECNAGERDAAGVRWRVSGARVTVIVQPGSKALVAAPALNFVRYPSAQHDLGNCANFSRSPPLAAQAQPFTPRRTFSVDLPEPAR